MAKVWFIPAGGTLAAYLSGEIDHHAACIQVVRRIRPAQYAPPGDRDVAGVVRADGAVDDGPFVYVECLPRAQSDKSCVVLPFAEV